MTLAPWVIPCALLIGLALIVTFVVSTLDESM